MPELPEVELTARHLYERMRGRSIMDVQVLRGHDRYLPGDQVDSLLGRSVFDVSRAGKLILIVLDDGRVIRSHLAMSGLWSSRQVPWSYDYVESKRPAGDESHVRVVFKLDDGDMLYHDQRLFGRMSILEPHEVELRLPYGPVKKEYIRTPLGYQTDVDIDLFRKMVLTYRPTRTIRQFLCDQEEIPGLGNIYSAEAMWRAGIFPGVPANQLSQQETTSLFREVRACLWEAIDRKLDYSRLGVYRRDRCSRCMCSIDAMKIQGRSVYFCGVCQPG